MSEVVVGLETILALHDKTNNTLDRKIFGLRLHAFGFPSSHENSGISLTSIESYLYTIGGENHILRRFDFETINVATENFSRSNLLSEDFYGIAMYKGKLQNGQDIATVGMPYSDRLLEFCMNQVSILVKIEHPNLAQFLGWCIEGTNVYLLYDISQNYYTTLGHLLYLSGKTSI
ncbi:putative non-specific serine/threonine protein kinase [Helianthus annuus]|nr:putative non-specific serine/threonine protein kinase [Helianthus annuus]